MAFQNLAQELSRYVTLWTPSTQIVDVVVLSDDIVLAPAALAESVDCTVDLHNDRSFELQPGVERKVDVPIRHLNRLGLVVERNMEELSSHLTLRHVHRKVVSLLGFVERRLQCIVVVCRDNQLVLRALPGILPNLRKGSEELGRVTRGGARG